MDGIDPKIFQAIQHELVETLANVKEVGRVTWDSLSQCIAVEVGVGKRDGTTHFFVVSIAPEAAERLCSALDQVLSDRPDQGWTAQ